MFKKQYNSLVSTGKGSIKNLMNGERVLSDTQLVNYRRLICNGCPQWDASGFLGVGKCKVCGCSGFKLNIRASICPLLKWGK